MTLCAWSPATATPRHRRRSACAVAAAAALLCQGPQQALAQALRVEPALRTEAVASSNLNWGSADTSEAGALLDVMPSLALHYQGPRLRLAVDAGLDLRTASGGSTASAVLPRLDLELGAVLVENGLTLDVLGQVQQSREDPYGATPQGPSAAELLTLSSGQVRPAIDLAFGPQWRLSGHATQGWTRVSHAQAGSAAERPDATLQDDSLRFERRPEPMGYALEVQRQRTGPDDSAGAPAVPELDLQALRASVSLLVQADGLVSAWVGAERSDFGDGPRSDRIEGARVVWQPGPRTALEAQVEHRFFGWGGHLTLRQRTPWLALSAQVYREPTTYAMGMQQGAAPDVDALLDALLTTRHPDAEARHSLVRSMMLERGLPSRLAGPLALSAEYPQLAQGIDASALLLGVRNAVTLRVYARQLRALARSDGAVPSQIVPDADNREIGASLGLNHRLTPVSALDATLWVNTLRGLAQRLGERSDQQTFNLSLNTLLAPRTSLSFGLRLQRLRSNVVASGREAALLLSVVRQF
jgi:uncharacterized protein (PEP-CTERM system associated)